MTIETVNESIPEKMTVSEAVHQLCVDHGYKVELLTGERESEINNIQRFKLSNLTIEKPLCFIDVQNFSALLREVLKNT